MQGRTQLNSPIPVDNANTKAESLNTNVSIIRKLTAGLRYRVVSPLLKLRGRILNLIDAADATSAGERCQTFSEIRDNFRLHISELLPPSLVFQYILGAVQDLGKRSNLSAISDYVGLT